jgi:hypothetical protein
MSCIVAGRPAGNRSDGRRKLRMLHACHPTGQPDMLPRNARIAVASSAVANTGTPERGGLMELEWNGAASSRSLGAAAAGGHETASRLLVMCRTRTTEPIREMCRSALTPGVRMLPLSRGSISAAVTAPRFYSCLLQLGSSRVSIFQSPEHDRFCSSAGKMQSGSSTA